MNKKSLILMTYTIAFIGLIVDQLTKYIARATLFGRGVDLGLIRFDLVYNTGAAYGMFSNFTIPLLVIGVVVIIYLLFSIKQYIHSRLTAVAYGAILGGAFGNTLDRLLFSKVTDFINIQIIPVFNVADILLNIGIGCIILDYVCQRKNNTNSA